MTPCHILIISNGATQMTYQVTSFQEIDVIVEKARRAPNGKTLNAMLEKAGSSCWVDKTVSRSHGGGWYLMGRGGQMIAGFNDKDYIWSRAAALIESCLEGQLCANDANSIPAGFDATPDWAR